MLIRLYRTAADRISEHLDKMIDVVRGSRIVNLSLCARRTMTLRTKKDAAGSEQGANGEGHGHPRDGDGGAAVQRTTQRI